MKDERIGHALERLCLQLKKKDPQLNIEEVRLMCNYVRVIQEEYQDFKKEEEDAILFGREADLLALKHASPAMRVVPLTK